MAEINVGMEKYSRSGKAVTMTEKAEEKVFIFARTKRTSINIGLGMDGKGVVLFQRDGRPLIKVGISKESSYR